MTEIENRAKAKMVAIKQDLENTTLQKQEIYKAIKGSVRRLQKGSTVSEEEYLKLDEYDAANFITVGMGAESLLTMVKSIDLDEIGS